MAHFPKNGRVWYRVFTASPPMRLSNLVPTRLMISASFYSGADSADGPTEEDALHMLSVGFKRGCVKETSSRKSERVVTCASHGTQ